MNFPFDNTYARLPERFYARTTPVPVRSPRLLLLNRELAAALGLDEGALASEAGVRVLAGNVVPEAAEPIALAYAGHQFGGFVPRLGDGRAILLGEIVGADGVRRDVQLKGSGPTPFSRGGDGRAALGPVLREYLVSEAMAKLGIPTTRALAAVATGETVMREMPLPGAVLTRVAASHLRVGTFQYFAAREDREGLETLAKYAAERHYPDALAAPNVALELLDRVVAAQATLVARWFGVGFVHGVMNTDNTSISGETIDFGPCAFLDEYHPMKRFSAIDHGGRYAFMNQHRVAQWNLNRLAEALLPLIHDDEDEAIRLVTERLEAFSPRLNAALEAVMGAKLGLVTRQPGDLALVDDLLSRMAASTVDFTLFFRRLSEAPEACGAMFDPPAAFHEWAERWRARLAAEGATPDDRAAAMRRANPRVIPRNHRVEEALRAAIQHDDLGPFEALHRALARPFDDDPASAHLAEPPAPEERVTKTFCGT